MLNLPLQTKPNELLQRSKAELVNAYRTGILSKEDLVLELIKHFDENQLDEMLKISSDVRVESQANPLTRFKKDRPEQMDFIESMTRITIALCGNRWGKTIAMMWHLCSTATGQNPAAKHQPDPSRPLRVWVIGESWPVLNDTILKEITGLLLEHQYDTHKQNSYVSNMEIYAPNGGITYIRFIPSGEDGDQKFESAALHYVYVDEGIRAALFRQIVFRIGDSNGQLFQAFTRLPENMHLADYLIDLEEGEGEFAELLNRGYIRIIHGSTEENIYNTRDDIAFLEASVSGNEMMKQARLHGRIDRPKGAVFNYRKSIRAILKDGTTIERDYNFCSYKEWAKIALKEAGRWDLCHDYGQSAAATWVLIWTSRVTGTSYVIEVIKKAGMSIQESSERCYDMIMRWECYGDLKYCFADKQIKDRGRKDRREDAVITTEQQYRDKYADDGKTPCFPRTMKFQCKQSDKNNRKYTISLLQELIEEENPLTPGLPYLRVCPLAKAFVRELRFLRWFQPKKYTENVRAEVTEGDDHTIDPVRYFIKNKVNHLLWKKRKELRKATNEMKFLVGGSMVPFFNI